MNRARKALSVLREKAQDQTQKKPVAIPVGENLDDELVWEQWDPMRDDYTSNLNTLALNPEEDPTTIITGQVAPNASQICRTTICDHFVKYGECVDGKFCSRLHVDPRVKDRIRSLQSRYENNTNRTCINFTYLLPVEFEVDPRTLLLVSVTGTSAPNNFYFIAPYDKMNFEPYKEEELDFFIERVHRSSLAKTKLENYHNELAALFDHPYRIDNVNDEIYLSQIVACKLQDGRFRRAMVTKIPNLSLDEFNHKLLLLDVGVEIELPRELIYDIKAYNLNEPPLAVSCRLDLVPANDQVGWSEEALDFFTTEARSKKFWLCKIIDYIKHDRIYTIELYDIKTRKALSESLIHAGLAEKCSL